MNGISYQNELNQRGRHKTRFPGRHWQKNNTMRRMSLCVNQDLVVVKVFFQSTPKYSTSLISLQSVPAWSQHQGALSSHRGLCGRHRPQDERLPGHVRGHRKPRWAFF